MEKLSWAQENDITAEKTDVKALLYPPFPALTPRSPLLPWESDHNDTLVWPSTAVVLWRHLSGHIWMQENFCERPAESEDPLF
ncbi:hypothetical protein DPEC_G00211600 [Dallia pectoralis]|uniref:Uncharacterized protein n=1 Tax=Dallia pectoralis TaxID=75939 RepID=A0ACC2G6A2_DALPE|nr:hypothetical protein DPEC_G00211600 [Dallia pectoralis]